MQGEKVNNLLERFYDHFYSIEEYSLQQGIKSITTTELHVIEAIGNSSLTMNELSDKLQITMGTATVAITKLCDKGFIKRYRSENDRRKVFVSLGDKGIEALTYHTDFHKNIISKITKNLTGDEIESFIQVFSKIINNLEYELDYSKPIPITDFPVNSTIKIVKIKGTPAVQSFFLEKSVFEGAFLKITSSNENIVVVETEKQTVPITVIDAKNIFGIKND